MLNGAFITFLQLITQKEFLPQNKWDLGVTEITPQKYFKIILWGGVTNSALMV